LVFSSRHDHQFSPITKLKKKKEKRKRKRQTLVESGKWRNLEQLGQNKTNVSPKKAREGGQLTGQGGQ
jgi:hypothetical protein